MARQGLRLLSLDGGGTRGLATLYILRELMSSVAFGDGGNVRPNEYFDLIGASSLSGLCALLFVRFCYTIDQAIEFLQDLSQKLDAIEDFRIKVLRKDVEDADHWLDCIEEFIKPADQLEALRQGIIQDSWSTVIKNNITNDLERYPHMKNGGFDFKSPSAIIEASRPKAFVVSSESPGYSRDGGFSDDHRYNVPILHRTYNCRHGSELYAFYAMGLATVASPGIIKPGIIFPNFSAVGKHTTHNPVRLVLEEANLLWPGLHVATLTSIGSGTFELYRGLLNSFSSTTASACLRICEENQKLAEELQKFVLPFDKNLALTYSRFNTAAPCPYSEYASRRMIQAEVTKTLTFAREATKMASVAKVLRTDSFPTAPEDQIALASLASLLQQFLVAGYSIEATIITDVISNFILYEAASGEDGSFRKLAIATEAEEIGGMIEHTQYTLESEDHYKLPSDLRSEAMIMNGLMAFGGSVKGGLRPPRTLLTLSDYAAGAYYALTILKRADFSEQEEPRFRMLLQQLSSLMNTQPEITQQLTSRIESFLELAALAALCEAAITQFLRGCKGLSHNGSLIRRIHGVLLDTSLRGVSQKILGPVANMLAILIQTHSWSGFRDGAIATLLDTASARPDDNWSLVNLAVARYSIGVQPPSGNSHDQQILSVCETFLKRFTRGWSAKSSEILSLSIKNGYFGLLWKCLRGEELTKTSRIRTDGKSPEHNNSGVNGERALHQAASLGFPHIMETIIEVLGMTHCRYLANQTNDRRRTPLHLACSHRAPKEIFRLLFHLGADANLQCDLGRTPLHYCFPDQSLLPPVHEPLVNIITEFSLPTIGSLDTPQLFDIDGREKLVEPRVYDFRAIITQLLDQKADFSITDHDGMTPIHQAVKNGWFDNFDLFFMLEDEHARSLQRICLRLRDNAGLTVLDYARRMGTKGGEAIIVSEMMKRGMEIPPKSAQPFANLETQYIKMRIPKPKIPLPEPGPEAPWSNIYQAPASSNLLQPNSSPASRPWRFSPVYVYQDPDVVSSNTSTSEGFGSGLEEEHELYSATNTWETTSSTIYDPSDFQKPQATQPDTEPEVEESQTFQKPRILKRFMKGKEKGKH